VPTYHLYPADSTTLRQIALDLWPRVFGFARSLTGDGSRAEDLCQETYLRFFGMKRPVDRSRSILPLLLTIVRNLVRDEARRPQPESLEIAAMGGKSPAAPADRNPAGSAARREERDNLRDALSRLSPLWRSVLYLRDGLGFSYREIAGVVERTEDTVRVTLHRARQRMRELLKGSATTERRAQ
jgi:RNA polymerase sigma-70 factor, ECF subfamily